MENDIMVSGNPSKRNPTYYHGGVPGLRPNTVLLSKNAAAREGRAGYWVLRGGNHSPDHVYFTTDLDLARSFAHALKTPTGRGHVYRAQPIGPVEADADYAGYGDVFMARSARIIQLVQRDLVLTRAEETRPFAMRQNWDINRPYADGDGYVQPSPQMRDAGWTPELMRMLPPWVPFADLGNELSDLAIRRTSEVLAASPGIGRIDRTGFHKASGLRDEGITALCLAHYGSLEALHAAQQQPPVATNSADFPNDSVAAAGDTPLSWSKKLRGLFGR